MIIERSGVRLIRLTEEYIELVRQKRNLPEIQSKMEYREYITPDMQRKWFDSVNNSSNYYFLIETENSLIGLISASNLSWEDGIVNNGGIFIWDTNYFESPEVLNASLLLTDFGFYTGIEKNYIKILKDNKRSIIYNSGMGYELLPDQELINNQKYVLFAETYFKMTEKIKKLLKITDKIKLIIPSSEFNEWKIRMDKGIKYNKASLIEMIVS